MPNPSQLLPYFHVRAACMFSLKQFYRVYVRPQELWFIKAGPGRPGYIPMQPVMHGTVDGYIAGLLAARTQKKTETRQHVLDNATAEELEQFLAEDSQNFRVMPSDLLEARIDPKSIWHVALYANPTYVGLLRLRYRDRRRMKLEVLAVEDMHIAVYKLPSLLGDIVRVQVAWNENENRYEKIQRTP